MYCILYINDFFFNSVFDVKLGISKFCCDLFIVWFGLIYNILDLGIFDIDLILEIVILWLVFDCYYFFLFGWYGIIL